MYALGFISDALSPFRFGKYVGMSYIVPAICVEYVK